MDPLDEIRRLYFAATKASITRDLARAIELLKAMPDEATRERAAVYMDGLSQMRSEWGAAAGGRAHDDASPAGARPGPPGGGQRRGPGSRKAPR
jgi:hypothetical protein